MALEELKDFSNKSKQVKVDLRTGIEKILFTCCIASLLAAFGGFFHFMNGYGTMPLKVTCIVLLICIFCYMVTDNFLVLDLVNQRLVYHFRFLTYAKIRKVADFSQIHAVIVNMDYYRAKGERGFFRYWTEIVFSNGRTLAMTDRIREDKVMPQTLAKIIADNSDAEYVQDIHTTNAIVVKKPNGRYSFAKKPEP